MESARFDWRVHSTLKRIAGIKLDETSDRELLRLVPSLSSESVRQQVRDSRLRRYSCVDGDVENGFRIKLMTNCRSEPINRLLISHVCIVSPDVTRPDKYFRRCDLRDFPADIEISKSHFKPPIGSSSKTTRSMREQKLPEVFVVPRYCE